MLLTAHGVLAETVSFPSYYARCVVFFGIPYQYQLNMLEKVKLEYLQKSKRIDRMDYATFDAMRIMSSFIGRVMQSQSDYSVAILADKV